MNMNPKDIIGPTAVLVGVCLVFTAAVVGTNSLTAEKIEVLNQKTADEAKMEVLPEADGFLQKQFPFPLVMLNTMQQLMALVMFSTHPIKVMAALLAL